MTPSAVKPLWPAALCLGLITACNFPADDGAAVGSKGLWVANGTNVVEYNPAQLGGGTAARAPHVSINSAVLGTPQGLAFDPAGNLWVLDPSGMVNGAATPALFEFSAAQLAALGTDDAPEPVAILTSSFLKWPQQAVIDTLGNAWVTDHDSNTVQVYSAAQLAKTGANAVSPVVSITSGGFNGVSGITFDSAGNMWISNSGPTPAAGAAAVPGTTIIEITAAHIPALPETGTSARNLVPDVTLTDNGAKSIQAPWALAFDSAGNLWLSNSDTSSTLVQIAKANLISGAPTPAATLSAAMVNQVPSLDAPNGLCIDDVGNLAAVNSLGAFSVAVYSPSQLATGSPAPATFIVGEGSKLNAPAGCAFGPLVK